MGPKNLSVVITKNAPSSITYTHIDSYANKTIGIDANLLLYKMIYAIRHNGYDILNGDVVITHIHSILSKFRRFIHYNITPVFVFDGIPPVIKSDTIEQRKSFQELMKQKYEQAQTVSEKKKYYFMRSDIDTKEISDFMELISIFGWTYVEAIGEADPQLAVMSASGIIDYVASDDLDLIVFGSKNLLKNFTVDKKKSIQEIDVAVLQSEAGLSADQIIDLVILLGCDYCKGLKGVGPVSAYKMIKQYGSIEQMVHNKVLSELPHNYAQTKKHYLKPLVMSAKSIEVNSLKLDKDKLESFLSRFAYSASQIRSIISQLSLIPS